MDGKKKSKYLDDETAAVMAEHIARRRELQQELKTAKALLPKASKRKPPSSDVYNTSVLTGEVLRQFVSRSDNLKSRPCLHAIQEFLNSDNDSRVLILYGLRRTGKTTVMQQTIAGLTNEQFHQAAFLQVKSGDTLASVNQDMKQLQSQGFHYVFLDEVTLMEDFIEGAALFPDVYRF